MEEKKNVWIFQVTYSRSFTWEDAGIVNKWKSQETNRKFSNSSTQQCHKKQPYKAKIDETQQNCKCRLCGDKNKTINRINKQISAKKDTDSELCRKSKLYLTNKRQTHQPESVQENEKHTVLWNLEIQIDHVIAARRLDQVIVTRKGTCRICNSETLWYFNQWV